MDPRYVQTSTEFGSDEPLFDIDTLDLETELAAELGKLIANDHDPELYHVPPTLHQPDPSPATSTVDIYNYGPPTTTSIAATSPPQPMFWDVLSSSSSSSSASSPALSSPCPQSPIPSTPQPTFTVTSPTPTAVAAQAEEAEAEPLVYYFSLLPEKAKTIWIVFFHSRLHSLADFVLWLSNTDTASAAFSCRELALEANTALSWTTTDPLGGPLHQHKVAFNCPNTTFERAMFQARLVNRASGLALDLGPLSIVSTTSQRTDVLARLEKRATRGSAHQRLIVNFKSHPASRRHHMNGKGGKQRNLRGLRFLHDELDKAVQMGTRI